jgi:hypothetical protein
MRITSRCYAVFQLKEFLPVKRVRGLMFMKVSMMKNVKYDGRHYYVISVKYGLMYQCQVRND